MNSTDTQALAGFIFVGGTILAIALTIVPLLIVYKLNHIILRLGETNTELRTLNHENAKARMASGNKAGNIDNQ